MIYSCSFNYTGISPFPAVYLTYWHMVYFPTEPFDADFLLYAQIAHMARRFPATYQVVYYLKDVKRF